MQLNSYITIFGHYNYKGLYSLMCTKHALDE